MLLVLWLFPFLAVIVIFAALTRRVRMRRRVRRAVVRRRVWRR